MGKLMAKVEAVFSMQGQGHHLVVQILFRWSVDFTILVVSM